MTIFKIRIYFFVISYNLKNIMNRNLLLPISSLFTYFNTKYYGLLLTLVLLMNIGSVAQTNAHTPTAGQYALTATMIGSVNLQSLGYRTISCGTDTMIYDNEGVSWNYDNNTNSYLVLNASGTVVDADSNITFTASGLISNMNYFI